jgi:hypothetical protein
MPVASSASNSNNYEKAFTQKKNSVAALRTFLAQVDFPHRVFGPDTWVPMESRQTLCVHERLGGNERLGRFAGIECHFFIIPDERLGSSR